MPTIVKLAVIGLLMFAYFLLWIVSWTRHHRNTAAIFILNLFLGWTFLGWVASLVWANTDNTSEPRRQS